MRSPTRQRGTEATRDSRRQRRARRSARDSLRQRRARRWARLAEQKRHGTAAGRGKRDVRLAYETARDSSDTRQPQAEAYLGALLVGAVHLVSATNVVVELLDFNLQQLNLKRAEMSASMFV